MSDTSKSIVAKDGAIPTTSMNIPMPAGAKLPPPPPPSKK
jgi:hypothetical protein